MTSADQMGPAPSFNQIWQTPKALQSVVSHLDPSDLLTLRLVCKSTQSSLESIVFQNLCITFRSSTFTRPARIAAIERVGHRVRTLALKFPHGPETFLPPLIEPLTGEERSFLYEPQPNCSKHVSGRVKKPRYGDEEMTSLLVKQYPPLFHAATNIPSFIRVLSSMPNLTCIRISCPSQDGAHRYRRSTVDYALISLRIAIERSPLSQLRALFLSDIHPLALLYLRPALGFGASPRSLKRWSQVKQLDIEMRLDPSLKAGTARNAIPADHLKILHSFFSTFYKCLESISFRWIGARGPCPFALNAGLDQFGQTNPAEDNRHEQKPRREVFSRLSCMRLENTLMGANQVSTFIKRQRSTLKEFNFEDVVLSQGDWEQALAPLTPMTTNKRRKVTGTRSKPEIMEVPLMMMRPQEQEEVPVVLQIKRHEASKNRTLGKKSRRQSGEMTNIGVKGNALLSCTPEHVKKFLRSPIFNWI